MAFPSMSALYATDPSARLLDGIGAVDSDTVRISFTTPTRPAVITGKGEALPDYRYVIMPIRSAG
jgi:DNA polymerase III subunit beta